MSEAGVEMESAGLDAAFRALADPTRRQLVARLAAGARTVSDLAEPVPMSLPAVHQHLRVLEGAGLVRSEKRGRVRWCRLGAERLREVEDWVLSRRRTWERRLDALEEHLAKDPPDSGAKPKKRARRSKAKR